MNNIIEPNDNFDFTKLSLGHPNGIQGGAYFTKILHNNSPLYIQTTKSLTRQGFVKTGKKYYCDLMFDNNSEMLIRWFENLEETCQKLIFDKSESWFQNSLDKNDVETAFNSVLRIYKSGKYYLLRTHIKNSLNNEPSIKIYNENEYPLTMNDINTTTNLISILEIQGIKFTSRNFQIEIELKQAMILDDQPIFDNCLIKSSKKPNLDTNLDKNSNTKTLETNSEDNPKNNFISLEENFSNTQTNIPDISIGDSETNESNEVNETNETNDTNATNDNNIENDIEGTNEDTMDSELNKETNILLDFEDLNNKDLNNEDLKEVELNIDLENNLETLSLKQPNEVYYELYKQAREKAKIAKKAAIVAYLEAKNIKKTYMLDNIDADSDIDAEIDEISESELEEL